MQPTPKCYREVMIVVMSSAKMARQTDLESRKHLPLFLPINEVVVVLHGYEGCEVVVYCVVFERVIDKLRCSG